MMITVGQAAKWIIIAIMALGTLAMVAKVGKTREPTTPGQAVFGVIFNGAIVAAIIAWWH